MIGGILVYLVDPIVGTHFFLGFSHPLLPSNSARLEDSTFFFLTQVPCAIVNKPDLIF